MTKQEKQALEYIIDLCRDAYPNETPKEVDVMEEFLKKNLDDKRFCHLCGSELINKYCENETCAEFIN